MSIFLTFNLKAEILPGKSLPNSYHVVNSDTKSKDVEVNKCRVKGYVYVLHSASSRSPLPQVLVSTLDRKHQALSDSTGYYEMLVNVGDTTIFAFKPQLSEVVIWNYPFASQHEVVIDFYLGMDIQMLEVDKPVIYLYSALPLQVNISLNFLGDLSFSYPDYNTGWSIELKNNKIQIDNRSYPYLFWEGESNQINYIKEEELFGFYLNTDTVVSFLENSLTQLGLNSIEQTDFITFWAPRMIQSEYVFLQFLVDENYNEHVASINVDPLPNSSRRVYMLFTPYDSEVAPVKFKSQELQGFIREDFSLIEWGGSEIRSFKNLEYVSIAD